jgi:hypothetical protein
MDLILLLLTIGVVILSIFFFQKGKYDLQEKDSSNVVPITSTHMNKANLKEKLGIWER